CAVGLKYRLGFDDSLDVVGVHMVGGVLGAVSLGFLAAYPSLDQQGRGLLYGGGLGQLGLQLLGPAVVAAYSFAATWVIAKIIDRVMGFRIGADDEVTGIDVTSHAETGYDLGTVHASGVTARTSAGSGAAGRTTEKTGRTTEKTAGKVDA
ncbi:ammonia channel protein, partial [Streptosporangium algeriense]